MAGLEKEVRKTVSKGTRGKKTGGKTKGGSRTDKKVSKAAKKLT
jgi:hypothetical protein